MLFKSTLIACVTPTAQQYCYQTGNYTSNDSTYRANLVDLHVFQHEDRLRILQFHRRRKLRDKVNTIALCRGDVTPDVCRGCINSTSQDLLKSCPNQKEAIMWSGSDECTVRYSNRSIFGVMEEQPMLAFYNVQNASNVEGFNNVLRPLLDRLRNSAALGNSTRKFALKSEAAPDFQTIYSLLQCTPDLNSLDCNNCLLPESPPPSPPPPPIAQPAPPPPVQLLPPTQGMDEIINYDSLQFDIETIKVATDNFSAANKLGQGGFGIVYKGELPNGQEIAVKRLSKASQQGDLEFKNEVKLVATLQHRNLVRLLGFYLEGKERLLIYEFVPNASLEKFIFDADMNPKISDVGTARLFVPDQTQGKTSRIVGTYGYMPPEYVMRGQFSVKFEVFSFGVLVLEIVSGKTNNSSFQGENEVGGLLSYTWKNWTEGTTSNLVDATLKDRSTTQIMRCIHFGLLCVQQNVTDRPTMATVILMFNSHSVTLPVPTRPAFLIHSTRSDVLPQLENAGIGIRRPDGRGSSTIQGSINEAS
ncbi:hypothetical protein CIPAW_09G145900 [Carya illinoinensis]|uniref:Uncharacterized protein n=1 Tax=Carya illinoinensis TaxID=32201 RepID=A0A8T1PMS0_CARIL|nr:hypothetical protein CIPAW_09G145900 [Carya illinoinensis]